MLKKLRLKEEIVLSVHEEDNKIHVNLNGIKLIYEDKALKEVSETATVQEAKDIQAKYTKQEDGTYTNEDIKAIQKEVSDLDTYSEIKVFV